MPRQYRSTTSAMSCRSTSGSATGHVDAGGALHVAGVEELDRVLVDRVARVPGEELLERDARLEASHRGTEAHVGAVAEREDARVRAGDVELVGAVELAR